MNNIVLGGGILIKDGFVFVDAVINGHGPFRMLIDTGTTTSLLAPEAATEAGLAFDHRILLSSLGGDRPLPATSTGDLRVGSGRATGVEIVVTPIGHVRRIDPVSQGIRIFCSDRPTLSTTRAQNCGWARKPCGGRWNCR